MVPLQAPLAPGYEEWRDACQMLGPLYERYVAHVSNREFPASLEAGAFLFCLCGRLGVSSILDVGSGFTSVVFRRYARDRGHGVRVVSTDHDLAWLRRTGDFLEAAGYDQKGLMGLSDFEASMQGGQFDLIYNDAWGPLRSELTLRLAQHLAPRGALIVDDAQEVENRRTLMRVARSESLQLYDVRPWTHDFFGRWAILAM